MNEEERNEVVRLLLECESEGGLAPPYVVQQDTYREQHVPFLRPARPVRTGPVPYDAEGREVFVVSDLHIAAGRNPAGVYKGTENFFADDSFLRFLDHAHAGLAGDDALLVINGDIFDFLRVTEYPGRVRPARFSKRVRHALKGNAIGVPAPPAAAVVNAQLAEWSAELLKVGIGMTPAALGADISRRERKYGLGTADYKTIYKLMRIHRGHPGFFEALARWLDRGHTLLILKGNHDLELYWPAVRNYLRLILAEEIVARTPGTTVAGVLRSTVLPRITFADDAVLIDKDFYVEHGHRYDKFTMVLDGPTLPKYPTQINIPFGSFFNRYLINRIELFYPFLDNVRPSGNVLPMLMKENFPLAVKVLLQHAPLLGRMLIANIRYTWFMLQRVFWFLVVLGIPVAYIVLTLANSSIVAEIEKCVKENQVLSFLFGQLKTVASLLLAYVLSRVVAWFQLSEPDSLASYALERFKGTDYRIMTMGHTHNPGEYLWAGGRRFYNTGTWIPVIEISTADVRSDRTYTFLHLVRDGSGALQPAADGLLERWNDDAERADAQVLMERK